MACQGTEREVSAFAGVAQTPKTVILVVGWWISIVKCLVGSLKFVDFGSHFMQSC